MVPSSDAAAASPSFTGAEIEAGRPPPDTTRPAIGSLSSPEQAVDVRRALVEELAALTSAWKPGNEPLLLRPGLEDVADRLRHLEKAARRLSGGREQAPRSLQGHTRHDELARFFAKNPAAAEEARQAFSAAGLTDCDGWQALFEGVVVPPGEAAR